MGVKDVSLKSTFWGFGWVWSDLWVDRVFGLGDRAGLSGRPVVLSCLIGLGLVCLIYAAGDGRVCWSIYCGRGSPWPSLGLLWGVHSMGGVLILGKTFGLQPTV